MALSAVDIKQLPAPKPDKYSTIQNLQRSQKIEALKDPHLDPAKIKDPYDALAHNFHVWTQVVQKIKADPTNTAWKNEDQIASNFYDHMILPAYAQAKLTPMDKSLWLKQAFNKAAEYNIDDAYESNFTHDLRHGWNEGLAATARGFGRVSTMIGNATDDIVQLWKNQSKFRALPDAERQAALQKPWHDQLADFHNEIVAVPHTEGLVSKGAKLQDANHQFWSDALPTREGFWNKATSTIAEGVANTPLFATLELGPEAVGTSLTARLMKTPVGKKIAGYLMAGSTGLAYGAATHKQSDPGEAWRDALGFTVFHGLFDVGGIGLKKLSDVAPEAWKPKISSETERLDLAQQGLVKDTSIELYDKHKTEVANNIAVTGVPGQQLIFRDALQHIDDMQHFTGMSHSDVVAWERNNLERDPARWAPVLSSAKFIRDWLGDRKLANLTPGEEKELGQKLAQLTYDSSSEIGSRVIDVEEHSEQKATSNLKQPSAVHTLQYYQKKATTELAKAPGAGTLVTPEQLQQYAEKLYAKDLQKATTKAERELTQDKVVNASRANRAVKQTPGFKIRSERTTNKYGEPSARYNIVPDYKVRLAEHSKNARQQGKSLADYFKDLDDKDFVDDINDYFYPKSLKKAEIFFEHQNTREGMQNPNFLSFMHNYISQMPKEFGQELESRLIDTMKVQSYMKGRSATDAQLSYYAKAMYNHVDNFLGSGRWPKEHNIFRTSNDNIFQTTPWQRELLIEKTLQEQKNLKSAFRGKARDLALSAHAALSKARMDEFDNAHIKRNSQDKIRTLDTQISNQITSTGKFDRWDF